MILLVDCAWKKDSLSRFEFVHPIEEILKASGASYVICHFRDLSEEQLSSADKVIICGTALQDNAFLSEPEAFAPLFTEATHTVPILGVCAGMQILGRYFDGTVTTSPGFGMTTIEILDADDPLFCEQTKATFQAYEMHQYSILPGSEFTVIARSDSGVQAIHHRERPIWGVQFHPEVRNEWVVERFLELEI